MVKSRKIVVLFLLLTFLGYCGGDEGQKSQNWLSTSDLDKLVAPTGLTAQCQSKGRILIQWDLDFQTSATHFIMERKSIALGTDFEEIARVPVQEGMYEDSVSLNKEYVYRALPIIISGDQVQSISKDYSNQTQPVLTTARGCISPV